jgi:hypothetical protein
MQENSPELQAFIRENNHLFWYTPRNRKESISNELLVENILNYGTLDTVRKLFKIMGIANVARIFWNMNGRKKLNFYPEIYNYFSLLFKRYA